MKKQTLQFILSALMILILVSARPLPSAAAAVNQLILTDEKFTTINQDFGPAVIDTILARIDSPLAGYSEQVGDQTLTAGDSIWVASQTLEYAINPKVLLITLALQNQSQVAPQNITLQAQSLAENLWRDYSGFINGEREILLANQETIEAGSDMNAASYAVASSLALFALSEDELLLKMGEWAKFFEDSLAENPLSAEKVVANVPQIEPFLQLPYQQPKESFIKVNSFFDHARPSIFDDSILRFDGVSIGSASFNSCTVGINCYGGHNGVDYKTGAGMPMLAAAGGKVIYRYFNTDSSRGTVDSGLIIDHGNGYTTSYWHMDPIKVSYGEVVEQGRLVGYSGNIGKSSGAHLHFGVKLSANSKAVDPYGWWKAGTSDPWGQSTWLWAGDLVADNREAQAQQFYTLYWNRDTNGYLGESYWTTSVTSASKSVNWGTWGTYITSPGRYRVYAYWPRFSENTPDARYEVFHDGGSSTVSVNQSTDGNRFVLLGTYAFSRGPAAVLLKDLSNVAGKRMYFDAVKWELDSASPTFTPMPDGPGTYDDRYPGITYSGAWTDVVDSKAFNGSVQHSSSAGGSAAMTFDGRRVSILYPVGENRGVMSVYIDNQLVGSINQANGSLINQMRWDSQQLSAGKHTLRLVHASGAVVALDGIVISGDTFLLPTLTPTKPSQTTATPRVSPTPTATATKTPVPTRTPTATATKAAVPAAPILVSPYATINAARPVMKWTAVPNATHYFYFIYNGRTNVETRWVSAAEAGCSGGVCSVQTSATLPDGDYSWWALAKNAAGESAYSGGLTFKVMRSTATVPGSPVLVAPVGTITTSRPMMTWSVVPGATDYYFFIYNGTNNVETRWLTAAQANCGTTNCSVQTTAYLPDGQYSWWALAKNAAGEGQYGHGKNFTVAKDPNSRPDPPVLIAPTGKVTDNQPVMRWKPVVGARDYYFFVYNGSYNVEARWLTKQQANCSTDTCSVKLLKALPNGEYTWWALARNDAGESEYGHGLRFTIEGSTIGADDLPAPVLLSPIGKFSTSKPTFTWSAVKDASSYLYLLYDGTKNLHVKWYTSADAGCNGTSCSITLPFDLNRGTYYWWVQAKSSQLTSPWSGGATIIY